MNDIKNKNGLKRCVTGLLTMAVLFCSISSQLRNTAAADSENNMYIPCAEDTMFNFSEPTWSNNLEVSDLEDGGIRLNWKDTNPDTVDGIAKAFPLDGLTMKLDNLVIKDEGAFCNLAFVITNTADWSAQYSNAPFALILEPSTGSLYVKSAEVEKTALISWENVLTYEYISQYPFQISFHKEEGSYRVDIDVNGEVRQAWIGDWFFNGITDPENVLVTLAPAGNSSNDGGLWQTMSVDLKAIGPCFVWPENERRVIPVKDYNTYLPSSWSAFEQEDLTDGSGLKLKWKAGAQDMRIGTSNSLGLDGLVIEMSGYNRQIVRAAGENLGLPAFVIGNAMAPDTWDSWGDMGQHIGNLTITFGENSLVANARNESCTIVQDNQLNIAQLVGKPIRLAFRAADDGSYNVEIQVGSWSAAGAIPKNVIDDANGLTDQSSVYVSATIAAMGKGYTTNVNTSYILNGIYNEKIITGDLNNDGKVDSVDLSLLRQAILFDFTDSVYDINGIAGVDILDLIHLKKLLS